MKNSMYKVMAAMACAAILAACGGGSSDSSTTTPPPPQPAYAQTDIEEGNGTRVASVGDVVTVEYTGWLYDAAAQDKKSAKSFETNKGGTPAAMSLGFGTTRLVGWDKGLLGMKVGGERTLILPASMAFGEAGFVKDGATLVPANTAVVYEMKLLSINALIPPQPVFTKTDTVVGTGTEAAANHLVGIHYTGYLYDDTKSDKKGAQFETSRNGSPFAFLLDVNSRIVGWDKGILGMKLGGKRTLLIPASMAYTFRGHKDAQGNVLVPPHTAVVYEVELTSLVTTPAAQTVQPAFTKIDTSTGSGTVAVQAKDKVTVHYNGYLYNDGVTDKRGAKFDSSIDKGTPFTFEVGTGVIEGWSQGVVGMKVGSKRTLIIPANLAYGSAVQGSIPANSPLIFDIEVLSITR